MIRSTALDQFCLSANVTMAIRGIYELDTFFSSKTLRCSPLSTTVSHTPCTIWLFFQFDTSIAPLLSHHFTMVQIHNSTWQNYRRFAPLWSHHSLRLTQLAQRSCIEPPHIVPIHVFLRCNYNTSFVLALKCRKSVKAQRHRRLLILTNPIKNTKASQIFLKITTVSPGNSWFTHFDHCCECNC